MFERVLSVFKSGNTAAGGPLQVKLQGVWCG
jgi:hypothetical protein